jgi:hypothetical protein
MHLHRSTSIGKQIAPFKELSFSLTPFPAPNIPAIAITGRVSFQNNLLSLRYALDGNIENMRLPPASRNPNRKNGLWKFTCFECFLAIKDQPGYWEFNMSPSGDWNVYRMDAYRRIGFRKETAISQASVTFKKESEKCSLDVSVDLTPVIRHGEELQMAIAAVIQTIDAAETYWALVHPASQPDFHLRESFILALAVQTRPSGQSAPAG